MVGIDPAAEKIRLKKEKFNEDKKLPALENSKPNFLSKILQKLKRKQITVIDEQLVNNIPVLNEETSSKIHLKPFDVKHIIIDCSCVNFIDSQGVNGILQVSLCKRNYHSN